MRKRSFKLSPEAVATRQNRHREVRDVYNKLRKKYKLEVVYQCFRENYFLQPNAVDQIIMKVDKAPVDCEKASIQYKTIMGEGFYL